MTHRRLPHIYPDGAWLFVTWHLYDSLPKQMYPPPGIASAGRAFVWMDRYLDTTGLGPMFLKDARVAAVIVRTLKQGQEMHLYDLRAFAVMANHVHVLLHPLEQASRVLQWLKGTTAKQANEILCRTGRPFWQRESYDHWVRDREELERIAAYIESNPVKAGLVAEASLYRWSSAWKGRASACGFSLRGLKSTPAR